MFCSYVHIEKTDGTKTPCQHPVYGEGKVCVFHSPKVGAKDADFEKALRNLLGQSIASPTPIALNFIGFIVPRVDFKKFVFRGAADFRSAIFVGDVDFRDAKFLQQADFRIAEFRRSAGFFGVIFETNARFTGTKFLGRAIFRRFAGLNG